MAVAAGTIALGWYQLVSEVAAGLVTLGLGACLLIVFAWEGSRFVLRAYRGRRGAWWIRACGNGFEINDRLLEPRRFDWRDIDDIAVVRESHKFDDGSTTTTENVGLRYRLDHPRVNSRRRRNEGIDDVIDGPWDRSSDDAVALLNSWRYPDGPPPVAAEAPSVIPVPVSEIPYPHDGPRGDDMLGYGLAILGGFGLTALGLYVMGLQIAFLGLAVAFVGAWLGFRAAVGARCAAKRGWWIRPSDSGFEINDRWSEPRTFEWCDIEAAVVAKQSVGEVNEIEDVVGIRYRPTHPSAHPRRRRKTGADLIIRGPWGMPAADAVALLNSWRNAAVEY